MYHLWRKYPTAPYYRWACEVAQDAEAPEGYRVLRHDPIVADTAFFHRLSDAMAGTHEAMVMKQDKAIVAHVLERVGPSDANHFEHAIRKVEGAILSVSPEKAKQLAGVQS